jgi:hypothetical protein
MTQLKQSSMGYLEMEMTQLKQSSMGYLEMEHLRDVQDSCWFLIKLLTRLNVVSYKKTVPTVDGMYQLYKSNYQ